MEVDFQDVDGEFPQISQGGIAGAEVVDGDPHAQCFQRNKRRALTSGSRVIVVSVISIVSSPASRPLRSSASDIAEEVDVLVELAAADVDRDSEWLAASMPLGSLAASFGKYPTTDRHDHRCVLRKGNELAGLKGPGGMLPSDEGLDAGDGGGKEVEVGW